MLYDIGKVMELIPHRHPFLLVDRVESIEGSTITALKNVTINEPFFPGHFPGNPVMPGVLIVEAMAQAGGILALHLMGEGLGDRRVYFMTIERARFRRPVVPGDQLRLVVSAERKRTTVWRCTGEATVDGKVVADAEFMAMIG
jgi:3-hydroxyacyl-[acyl-carrier-protein] dehydratase